MKSLYSLLAKLLFSTPKRLSARSIEEPAKYAKKIIKTFNQLAIENYLRDTSVCLLVQQVNPFVRCYLREKSRWHELLDISTVYKIEQIVPYTPIEQHVDKLRVNYEKAVLIDRQCFYDQVESNPLTKEQRLAVIRNNDRNLVLAAAGTGKTSVIVAKVLDLIDSGKASTADILVLAYNAAAAQELRERLTQRAQLIGLEIKTKPNIMTFHALGRMILQQAQIPTYLSVFVNDSLKREIWLSNWLSERLKTDSKALLSFIEISTKPINPFNFQNKSEYEEYIRDNEFRTLQNEKVENYEELFIANWLFLHSVNYRYKPRFVSRNSTKIGVNNTANFHLLDGQYQCTHLIKSHHIQGNEAKLEKRLNFIIKK